MTGASGFYRARAGSDPVFVGRARASSGYRRGARADVDRGRADINRARSELHGRDRRAPTLDGRARALVQDGRHHKLEHC